MQGKDNDFITDMMMKILTRPSIQEFEQNVENDIERALAVSGMIADVEVKINVRHFDYEKAKAFNEKRAKEQDDLNEVLKNLGINNLY